MRITVATGIYPPEIGGPATYASHLANDLFKQGWGVNVVTYGGKATPNTSPCPVERVSRNSPLPLRYLSFVTAVRRASRSVDLIYAQDPLSSGLPALIAARSRRLPLVVKIVGDLAWEIGSEQGWLEDDIRDFQSKKYGFTIEAARRAQYMVARNAVRIIVPSHFLKRLVTGWGVPENRIDVVYNSLPELVDMDVSREAVRRELSLGTDTVVLAAGRLVPWKRFDKLIRLMPEILSRVPSARLVIVGSGPCEKSLKALVSESELESVVSFTGPLDARGMRVRLLASDVLVLPSSYEGFPHLLLEAMRIGLPVLATDVGGNRELIENGKSGLLVPLDEPTQLVTALVELCGNPSRRAEIANAGAERAGEFSWSRLLDDTEATLRRASSNRTRPK